MTDQPYPDLPRPTIDDLDPKRRGRHETEFNAP